MVNALPDTAVTTAGTPVTIDVLANDTGSDLVITSFSNPANGSLVFNADKSFTYTPAAGFLGEDTFSYTVRDAQGTPATAEVTVSVVAENGAPIAMDDSFDVVADITTVLAVLANDSDPNGGPLQVVGFTMPSHGSLVFDSTAEMFSYTPNAGYEGQDQFTYTIRDNRGASATAAVTLTVARIVASPAAVDDQVTTEAGVPVTIDVLANDTGSDLVITSFSNPANGSLVFNADKSFTYTPAAGFLGEDTFSYTVRDAQGTPATAEVTVSVVAELPAGENLLLNSKLTGDATAAGEWSNRHPGEGTIVFSATDSDDHRKVRCVATGTSNRAAIEQICSVTAGKRYVFSVHVAAVDAATDPSRVIINHAPFSSGDVLGGAQARPTLGTVSAGQRVYYVFDATATGQLKLVLGLDGAGDVTLERPMLDESDELRAYVPTSLEIPEEPDEPEPEPEGSLAAFGSISRPVDSSLPYQGRFIGEPKCMTVNAAAAASTGSYGHRIIIPYTGNLRHFQMNLTSGRTGEGSKSAIDGDRNSDFFNYTWFYRLKVQRADANWQPTGPVLRDIPVNHFRESRADGRSRQNHQTDLNSLAVTAGERMLFWYHNAGPNPSGTFCAYNLSGGSLADVGLNPPRHRGLLYGDGIVFVRNTSNMSGQNMTPILAMMGNNWPHIGVCGIRYTDGREYGSTLHDGGTNTGVFHFNVYDNTRLRQPLRLPNRYYRFFELWAGSRRIGSPAAITARITGPNISAITMTLPSSAMSGNTVGVNDPYDLKRFPLPAPFIGLPGAVYTIEFWSTGSGSNSSNYHRMYARRRNVETTIPSSPGAIGFIDCPPDDHEVSYDGGASWAKAGWSAKGQTVLACGLFSDGHVATTEGGLP